VARLHAVVIGVNSYRDQSIPALRFACQDAQDLSSLLTGSAIGPEVTVHLLLEADATRAKILHAVGVEVPRRLRQDDLVLCYFAGHGSPELVPGQGHLSRFLICHDTIRESLLATAIDIEADLSRLAVRLCARLVLFVIDACFSGYGGGRGITGPVLEEQRRLHRPALRLADLALGSGTVYLSACGDDEVAGEDGLLGHGVFSHYFLLQLGASGQTPTIGLATLYDLVFRQVHTYSGGRQNPTLWGNVKGGSLPRLARS
jgi:uncharacterized caspase-like protein